MPNLTAIFRPKSAPPSPPADALQTSGGPWAIFHLLQQSLVDADADELAINAERGLWLMRGANPAQELGTIPRCLAAADDPSRIDESKLWEWLHDLAWSVGARLDAHHPATGGRWQIGEGRWHAAVPPLVPDGSCFVMRRHRFSTLSPKDFPGFTEADDALRREIARGRPLLFCGPTGSGKSSVLNLWCERHFSEKRLVILESLPELPLSSRRWLRLSTSPGDVSGAGCLDHRFVVPALLRLRPEAIAVGEIRGDEVELFLSAAASGHGSVCATVHARERADLAHRFPQLLACDPALLWVSGRGQVSRVCPAGQGP